MSAPPPAQPARCCAQTSRSAAAALRGVCVSTWLVCVLVQAPTTPGFPTPKPKEEPASAFKTMNLETLKRQNTSLSTALQISKRSLVESASKLESATQLLAQRDDAISVLDRHWQQLDEQLAALAARGAAAGDGGEKPPPPPPAAPALITVLEQLCTPEALGAGALDANLTTRCARTTECLQRAARALTASTPSEAEAQRHLEATLAQVESERSKLGGEMRAARDKCTQAERQRDELRGELERCQVDKHPLKPPLKPPLEPPLEPPVTPLTPP